MRTSILTAAKSVAKGAHIPDYRVVPVVTVYTTSVLTAGAVNSPAKYTGVESPAKRNSVALAFVSGIDRPVAGDTWEGYRNSSSGRRQQQRRRGRGQGGGRQASHRR